MNCIYKKLVQADELYLQVAVQADELYLQEAGAG
jgi:hypothetical protein